MLSHGPSTPYSFFDGSGVVPESSPSRATLFKVSLAVASSVYVEPVSDYVCPRILVCYEGRDPIDRFDRQPISRSRAEPDGASRVGNHSEMPGLLSPASRLRHTNPRGQVHGKRPVNHCTRKLARYRGRISLRLHPLISRFHIFPRVSIAKR